MKEFTVKIIDKLGMHARPASVLVQKTTTYNSEIKIAFKDKEFNAKSIMGVMSAGIKNDDTITFIIDGDDEEQAVTEIKALLSEQGLTA